MPGGRTLAPAGTRAVRVLLTRCCGAHSADGVKTVTSEMPDTITSWVGSAICTNSKVSQRLRNGVRGGRQSLQKAARNYTARDHKCFA